MTDTKECASTIDGRRGSEREKIAEGRKGERERGRKEAERGGDRE
jgi:hypothetical protein